MATNRAASTRPRPGASRDGTMIEAINSYDDSPQPRPVRSASSDPDNPHSFAARFETLVSRLPEQDTDDDSPEFVETESSTDMALVSDYGMGSSLVPAQSYPALIDLYIDDNEIIPGGQPLIDGAMSDLERARRVAKAITQAAIEDVVDSYHEDKEFHRELYRDHPIGVAHYHRWRANGESMAASRETLRRIHARRIRQAETISDSANTILAQAGTIGAQRMADDAMLYANQRNLQQQLRLRRANDEMDLSYHDRKSKIDYAYGTERRQGVGQSIVVRAQNEGRLHETALPYLDELPVLWARYERRPEVVQEDVFNQVRQANDKLQNLRKDMRVRGLPSNRTVYEAIEKGIVAEVIDAVVEGRHELSRMVHGPARQPKRQGDRRTQDGHDTAEPGLPVILPENWQ